MLPRGQFTSVTVGGSVFCTLDTQGAVSCDGAYEHGQGAGA